MPVDDLSGVDRLDEKQRAVLAEKLGITTCYELIMANRRHVVGAFGRRVIRPTLEDVAEWQDSARWIYAESGDAPIAAITSPGWEQVAAFVVAFEGRPQGEVAERRIVAEQAEIEPEASAQQRSEWAGWECDDACRWMQERVGVTDGSALPEPAGLVPADAAPVAEAPKPAKAPPAEPGDAAAPVRIDVVRVSLGAPGGVIELAAGSRPVPNVPSVWPLPARLLVQLGDVPTGSPVSVTLQLAGAGGQKRNVAGHLDGPSAEFELCGLADGQYRPTIVASTPDGMTLPCVMRLPAVQLVSPASAPSGLP